MGNTVHKIDPDADTIVTLTNPLVEFAVWDPPVSAPATTDTDSDGPHEDTEYTKAEEDTRDSQVEEDTVQYHVSSRHLMLASKRFRTMLSGEQWKEGVRGQDGMFRVGASDWDAEAFLIFFNAIHHQNSKVPTEVSLETLTKIAVLVDYYDCEDHDVLHEGMGQQPGMPDTVKLLPGSHDVDMRCSCLWPT